MKFAHDFQVALEKGEYPPDWVDSAISYRKLKKCIKKVQQELKTLGLDREILASLLQQDGWDCEPSSTGTDPVHGSPLRYSLAEGQLRKFTPKLTIAIDPRDGSPLDAWLSPPTRLHLRQLVREHNVTASHGPSAPNGVGVLSSSPQTNTDLPRSYCSPPPNGQPNQDDLFEAIGEIDTVEIPLQADSEFFGILNQELSELEILQAAEQKHLGREIVRLGNEINDLKALNSRKSKAAIQAWRDIFQLYTESQIFFSSKEHDAGARDAGRAQRQLQAFTKALSSCQQAAPKADKALGPALDRFLRINGHLLRLVKFQEINRIALSKILKKFDKQTALNTRASQQPWLSNAPFVAQEVARRTCYTISEELLQIIPQLDDYLCPVCFSISFRPVRLRCKHVFCIRCLIVMQRGNQDHCPLCRDKVVMEATSDDLDEKLATFLKKNFPREVREKQKANELAAGIDQFGEGFEKTHRCAVM